MRRLTILTIAMTAVGVFLVMRGTLQHHTPVIAAGAAALGYTAGLQHGLNLILRAARR
jgi:hypothetical protein